MELVFEMVSAQQFVPGLLTSRTFKQAGGLIGRNDDCDWVIPDRKRHLSGHHAQVSYRDGSFYLTDTSTNGVRLKDSGARLRKGDAHRIEHGSVFCLGEFEIRARLVQDPAQFEGQVGRPQPAGQIIPDDAFLGLDPLSALDQQERLYAESDYLSDLGAPLSDDQRGDYARIDMESLTVPELVPEAPAPQPKPLPTPEVAPVSEGFWQRLSAELGIDLANLPAEQREALALRAAQLLKQCVGGLQQGLRTRAELKNELRLAQTTVASSGNNPLKNQHTTEEAVAALLAGKQGQMPAGQAIGRAFRDLQAHQVAMLAGSRAAVSAMHEQFAPEQLALRFERERKPLLATAGSRWRAYQRWHSHQKDDGSWGEHQFAREFARAYEEQTRLIATLQTDV
ncbi:type VI secretion system-associated FHA domain protein TagH [Atopomonas sediminilitoris]|uniref:type VI secretion system-associated FHA domain protein TagH n=1 Tax=Atopomonas sediminilitoris TaxID=2919919 RepID=UPI001F4D875C|nr:type VI secretion system-associated FHA domain protein TagH [Atopomonas sediminilitoris]MCJ8170446.1 type VI secretion system-associated FHA domain protein TagH [Atopomonas sediminilitoris]